MVNFNFTLPESDPNKYCPYCGDILSFEYVKEEKVLESGERVTNEEYIVYVCDDCEYYEFEFKKGC